LSSGGTFCTHYVEFDLMHTAGSRDGALLSVMSGVTRLRRQLP